AGAPHLPGPPSTSLPPSRARRETSLSLSVRLTARAELALQPFRGRKAKDVEEPESSAPPPAAPQTPAPINLTRRKSPPEVWSFTPPTLPSPSHRRPGPPTLRLGPPPRRPRSR